MPTVFSPGQPMGRPQKHRRIKGIKRVLVARQKLNYSHVARNKGRGGDVATEVRVRWVV